MVAALNGNVAAKADVTAWVSATRTGLAALEIRPEVERLYYAEGTGDTISGVALLNGWAETLIKTGALTVGPKTVNTGLGEWDKKDSGKITYNEEHNDHAHISLDSSQLEK